MTKDRNDHIEWCKKRALEYIDNGNFSEAYTSIASDLKKNEETKDHPAILTGMQLMMIGELNTPQSMRKFIEGFN